MKFLFVFLSVCIFGASCSSFMAPNLVDIGDKTMLIRQRNILRLLDRIYMENTHQDQREIGKSYNILTNVHKYENTVDVNKCLSNLARGQTYRDLRFVITTTTTMGTLGGLPKHQPFVITNKYHRKEAVCLFNMFYHAKDFDTFYRTACWARDYCNEDLFVYALTVAVKHRNDCKKFVLPAPYEVTPFKFVNNDVIQKVQRLKMQGKIININSANNDGIYQDGKLMIVTDNHKQVQINREQKLTYFTDDVGLNSHYYHYHVFNPFWMNKEHRRIDSTRRGEFFLFYHQQLLARYYMERLSNGLGEIPNFYWDHPIDTGFVSTLRLSNGMNIANRPNKHILMTKDNFYNFMDVKDCMRVIRDTVRRGFMHTQDGGVITINKVDDVNKLGNFMQGNPDSVNFKVVYNCLQNAKHLLGNGRRVIRRNDRQIKPGALDFYETCLRDPMFYQLNKRFLLNFFNFKNTLPKYTREELLTKGVEVVKVNVGKLVTFFDHFDVDVTNAVYRTQDEKLKNKDDMIFVARQTRLNHAQFDVAIDVNSDKATDVVVRMFMGPKYDSMGNKMNINQNRHNFLQIDSFVHKLTVGKQTIVRNSRDFLITCDDSVYTRDFMRTIKDTLNTDDSNKHIKLTTCQGYNLLPNRLLLPKGKKGGMKFQFFVIINEHRVSKTGEKIMSNTDGLSIRIMDDRTFGYPFDRRINRNTFFCPNMFLTDVTVYHRGAINNKVLKNNPFFLGDGIDTGFMGNTGMYVDNTGFLNTNTGFLNTNTGFMDDNTRFMGGNTGFLGDNTGFMGNTDRVDNTGFLDDNTRIIDSTGFMGDNTRTNVDNTGFVQTKNY